MLVFILFLAQMFNRQRSRIGVSRLVTLCSWQTATKTAPAWATKSRLINDLMKNLILPSEPGDLCSWNNEQSYSKLPSLVTFCCCLLAWKNSRLLLFTLNCKCMQFSQIFNQLNGGIKLALQSLDNFMNGNGIVYYYKSQIWFNQEDFFPRNPCQSLTF